MLPGQLLVLPLELGDEDLPLDLLLLFQGQQLLLQLLLPPRAGAPTRGPGAQGALLARGGHGRQLLVWVVLVLVVVVLLVHPEVHGDSGRRETQREGRVDVHWREKERERERERERLQVSGESEGKRDRQREKERKRVKLQMDAEIERERERERERALKMDGERKK